MSKRKIIWTNQAAQQFKSAIGYIRQDSDQKADKVKFKVLQKIGELSDDKIVHRVDPYKINNDGHYLYFEILKLRIVYYALPAEVIILRIRHTKMEPKKY